ncbi:MAG: hypothetical protein ABI638_11820 [Ignavibacteriota bacterium]
MKKKFAVYVRMLNSNTLKHKKKIFVIPEGITVSQFLKKKFAGKKVILDNIL